MSKHVWRYNGDVDLEYGGFWWCEDDSEDYVMVVRVIPASDGGGPNNVYYVESGMIYMPTDKKSRDSARECGGYEESEMTRELWVDCFMAYFGIVRHSYNAEQVIRIGSKKQHADDSGWLSSSNPDHILRAGSSLRKFVEKTFLD